MSAHISIYANSVPTKCPRVKGFTSSEMSKSSDKVASLDNMISSLRQKSFSSFGLHKQVKEDTARVVQSLDQEIWSPLSKVPVINVPGPGGEENSLSESFLSETWVGS